MREITSIRARNEPGARAADSSAAGTIPVRAYRRYEAEGVCGLLEERWHRVPLATASDPPPKRALYPETAAMRLRDTSPDWVPLLDDEDATYPGSWDSSIALRR